VVVALFGFSPESKISVPRGVVSVELVRAPAAARPATSAPAAKPVPPKPVPIKPKKVVLPAEPTTPKVKPKAIEKPPPAKSTPAPAEEYEDVLAQLRAESGEDAPPTEIAKAAPAVIGTPGSPDGVATQALEARVEVNLDASGAVRGTPRVSRPSGNPWYDEGVVRAIQKSSPLPPPPEAGKWDFIFLPEDSY
jgi:colicin import membrane protein